jgi:hypothetical protein
VFRFPDNVEPELLDKKARTTPSPLAVFPNESRRQTWTALAGEKPAVNDCGGSGEKARELGGAENTENGDDMADDGPETT